MFGGVQGLPIRSNQNIRARETRTARGRLLCYPSRDAPHHPHPGGEEVVVWGSSARLYVCSHKTKRFIVALKYAKERPYRYRIASDLSWRTLDSVQGHSLRWLVEVFYFRTGSRMKAGAR